MPVPVLEIRGLRSRYGRIEALKGVDLTVDPGGITALVGANGAGKTTLLRTISGVQPASAGSVRFDGQPIDRLPSHRRVELGIAQVPEGRQVWAPLTVEDHLRLGAYRRSDRDIALDLDRVLALFPSLAERRRHRAGTLSGGQQQMLAIGRALMARPRLLLLDEPSMGLAPMLREQIMATVAALRGQGVTLFLVEQNAMAALTIADHAYVMETGRITLAGTGRELLGDEGVRAAYLGA